MLPIEKFMAWISSTLPACSKEQRIPSKIDRFSYGEQRFETLGLLAGISVSIVHTETEHEIRIISFRKATNREAKIYFSEIQN